MDELLAWLEAQGSGLGMHEDFRRRARAIGQAEPKHAAVLNLLAGLSKRFNVLFEDVPLPAATGEEARARLLALLRDWAAVSNASADRQLDCLNRVALSNLFGKMP